MHIFNDSQGSAFKSYKHKFSWYIVLYLGFFQSADAFGTTLDNVFYEPGGTRTDVALSKALAVFASGGRRRASKVLLVVTDNPTNDIRLSKDSLVIGRDLVEKPAESLKHYEVITFGLGVKYGLTPTEQTDLNEELKMLTLDFAGDKRVVEVEDFDGILKEANKVAGKICLGMREFQNIHTSRHNLEIYILKNQRLD